MVNARLYSEGGGPSLGDDDDAARRILSRIILISIRNEDEFVDFVEGDLPNLLDRMDDDNRDDCANGRRHHHGRHNIRRTRTKVGLVAFDGIAGFFRFSDPLSFQRPADANSTFYRLRGSRLLRISSRLRELSDAHDVPILITNQVTAFAEDVGSAGPDDRSSASSSVTTPGEQSRAVPALGLVWSNCVTTRFILRRTDRMVNVAADEIRGGPAERPKEDDKERCDAVVTGNRKTMRVRVARVLQSVNMPEDREVEFVIDTGDVTVVA
jgi:hypothetical protein